MILSVINYVWVYKINFEEFIYYYPWWRIIVGAITKNSRSTEICHEFSYHCVDKEFERIGTRMSDLFQIPKETTNELEEVFEPERLINIYIHI